MAFFTLAPGAGNQDPRVVEYFLRSDTFDGLARNDKGIVTPPQDAINALLQALASGQIRPASPEGEQIARSYGYSPAGPTDPNFVGNLVNSGTNFADITMGQVPGQPANTQATVELRRLLLDSVKAQEAAELARQQAEAAIRQGDTALAQQAQQIANTYDIQARTLDQQGAQFAATHGLAVEESAFRRDLANRQFAQEQQKLDAQIRQTDEALAAATRAGDLDRVQQLTIFREQLGFEKDKYTSELAANPKNLIQSALWQGSRQAGGVMPDATAFGGNANTQTAAGQVQGAGQMGQPQQPGQASNAFASYMGQQVPVAASVNALLQRQSIAPTGTFGANGFMTSLQDLQQNPDLRLNASNMDAASLRNVLQDEDLAPELDSTLRAQGQTTSSFANALRGAVPRQSNVNLQQGY